MVERIRCQFYCGNDRCTCECRPAAFAIMGLGCPELLDGANCEYCGECGKFGSTSSETDNCAACDALIADTRQRTPDSGKAGPLTTQDGGEKHA